jgi:hypothetical protein
MGPLQNNSRSPTLSESRIVLLGLVFAIVGLTFRDSFGFSSLLASLGIGLVILGTVYIAVDGREVVRLLLAFIALVAVPLLAYGSVVRWIGGLMIVAVIGSAFYTRIAK